jgi:heme exporter protein B
VLIPLMTILYNLNLFTSWLLIVMVLGTLGVSISGTLLAAMTVQTRAREALLPIVMLPVILPLMVAAVNATTGILNNTPTNEWITWPQVLVVVNIVYLVLCFLMFSYVVEE